MPDTPEPRFYVTMLDADYQRSVRPDLTGWYAVADEEAGGYLAFCRDQGDAIELRDALRRAHGRN
jgi:hypothetical protein